MSRDLDVKVARALGESVCECDTGLGSLWFCARCSRPGPRDRSADIAAAWKLVDWLKARGFFVLHTNADGSWDAGFASWTDLCSGNVNELPTAAEAICKLFLLANGVTDGALKEK